MAENKLSRVVSQNEVSSPFAPPALAEQGGPADRPATWYELEDKALLCGCELQLPEYCLVSGESVSRTNPLSLKLVAGNAWSASLLAAILLGGIAMAFGGRLAFTSLQTQGSTTLWIAGSLFVLGGAFLLGSLVLSSRQSSVQITGWLSPASATWKFWLDFWPATLAPFLPGLQSSSPEVWLCLLVAVELAIFIARRRMLRGTFLKAAERECGLFAVTGFSGAYLTILRRLAAENFGGTAKSAVAGESSDEAGGRFAGACG
jgi:hypothetical protein